MLTRLVVITSALWAAPVFAQEPLSQKMDKLADDLPKFADNPEGIGVGIGVGEPMGLAVAYRPHRRHWRPLQAGAFRTSLSIFMWTT